MTWPVVRTVHLDDPRTDGSRPLFAVVAGALLTLAGPAAAEGGVWAHADVRADARSDAFSDAAVAVVAGGTDLVGFGTIELGTLTLTLRSDVRGFVTLVVIDSADIGTIVDAFVTADGRVTVLADTDFVSLDRFLRPFGANAVTTTTVSAFASADVALWASILRARVGIDAAELASQAGGTALHHADPRPAAPHADHPPSPSDHPASHADGRAAPAVETEVPDRVRASVPVALRIGLDTTP